jgi:hypothetical protein
MQTPRMDMDTESILDTYGVFHHARVLANPKTAHLASAFEAAQNQLRSKMDARKERARKKEIALATAIHYDQEMDNAVKNFERDILRDVQDNRKHPLFLKYFPSGLRHITGADYTAEALLVEQLIATLEKETAGKLKKEHLSILKSTLAEYKTAIEGFEQAETNYKNAFAEERVEKITWKTAYQKQEAELTLLFVGHKSFVDSFFKKITRSKKKKDSEETELADSGSAAEAEKKKSGK